MYPEFLQPDGQVVEADASIPVDIEDLEEHLESLVVLGTSTQVTGVRCLALLRPGVAFTFGG